MSSVGKSYYQNRIPLRGNPKQISPQMGLAVLYPCLYISLNKCTDRTDGVCVAVESFYEISKLTFHPQKSLKDHSH